MKGCGMCCKNIKIVNDTFRVIRMMIISDALSCGITYDGHSDDCRGVTYAPRVINNASRVINYAPRVVNYAPGVIN